jgi:putative endopeptidase
MAKGKGWGFDVKELDGSIRPQDDFYHYVNRKWMRANPIPANEARWGTFMKLRFDTDKQVHALLKELDSRRHLPAKSAERMIRDFFRSGMDMKRRNTLGLSPLLPILRKIENVKSPEDLIPVIAHLHRIGVGVAWGAGVDQDAKRCEQYALHLFQGGLGLPDRDYYLKNDAESRRVREAYETHAEKLFRLMGRTSGEAARERDVLLAIETTLAKASMSKVDRRDPEKIYHKFSHKNFRKLSPTIDWNRYFKLIKVEGAPYLIVMQPKFVASVDRLFRTVSLEDWKTYLSWHVVNDFAGALSSPFISQNFSFYGKALSGTKVIRPLWRRVLGAVEGNLGELIGRIYVQKHFPAAAKEKMLLLVEDLFDAYRARIRSLDWMSEATKRKAMKKLEALNRKIGYPDKWKTFAGLIITPDDFVGNIIRSNEYEHRRYSRRLGKPLDRDEWFMYPQTVNAYFQPPLNDIAFPAAILQPPFFGLNMDDALNYGAIGAVIGHEITHGFDDEGSQYDAKGNLKNWWTPADRRRFMAKAKRVEQQFNQYQVAGGLKVNGKLTLGENIADLGGLSIAYDAYQLQLKRTGRVDINGLTPEQRFFISFAVFECENVRPEHAKTKVLTDPHSPGIFRINGPVSNFLPFYEKYGLKKGDALYRSPKDREMVW